MCNCIVECCKICLERNLNSCNDAVDIEEENETNHKKFNLKLGKPERQTTSVHILSWTLECDTCEKFEDL